MDKNFDNDEFEGNVSYLSSILEKNQSQIEHIDNQVNIITGISSAIFLFTASQFTSGNRLVFEILSVFAAFSVIAGLFAIHPPRFLRKKGQKESIFYAKRISEYPSSSGYAERLGESLGDIEKIKEQYAREIYNMCSFYYRPKRMLYRWSRNLLLAGVILAVIIYIVSLA